MIKLDDVLHIHEVLIKQYGGANGVRDEHLLISAIERPFAGFGESEFYPTPQEKAAAILESIVKNHPFADGNKRTGYVLMRLILMSEGKDVYATEDEKYDIVIRVASSEAGYNETLDWIRQHCR